MHKCTKSILIILLILLDLKVPMYCQNYNLTDVVTPVDVNALGYCGETNNIRRFAPNLKLRIGSKVKLWNKVMKEVKAGRYAGPYEEVPFKNVIQSPIGLVPKGTDGKDCRLIFHLSYPKNAKSVNSETDKNLCSVKYPDFGDAVQLCLEAGKSYRITGSDMSSAFRQLGIKPDDWPWLIMMCQDP